MTRACAFAALLSVGVLAAFEAPLGLGADPAPTPAVVTVVVTETVPARWQGWTARTWARKTAQARRDANVRGRTIATLQRNVRQRWAPTVDYALRLAATVYGVPYSKLRAVAWCESRLNVFARNGQYRSLFQEGPMFERGPFGAFGVYDPIANALTAAYTVVHDGSWRQWECG